MLEICELIPDEHEPWFSPIIEVKTDNIELAKKLATVIKDEHVGEIWVIQEQEDYRYSATPLNEFLKIEHNNK